MRLTLGFLRDVFRDMQIGQTPERQVHPSGRTLLRRVAQIVNDRIQGQHALLGLFGDGVFDGAQEVICIRPS